VCGPPTTAILAALLPTACSSSAPLEVRLFPRSSKVTRHAHTCTNASPGRRSRTTFPAALSVDRRIRWMAQGTLDSQLAQEYDEQAKKVQLQLMQDS
jgi:hypothetical protein